MTDSRSWRSLQSSTGVWPRGAHGTINGLFKATAAIDEVFSSDDIFAILDAPEVAGIRANDPSVLTDYPLPATPASIKAEVLADAALVYNEVLADRDAVFAANDDLLAAMQDLEAEVHDAVAVTRSAIQQAKADTLVALAEFLETVKTEFLAALDEDNAQKAAKFGQIRAQAAQDLQQQAKEFAEPKKEREAAYEAALGAVAGSQIMFAHADQLMAQAKQDEIREAERAQLDHRWPFIMARVKAVNEALRRQAAIERFVAFWSGAGRGLKTGAKANFNATVDTLWGSLSLGFGDDLHVLGGQNELGYGPSYGISRVSQEFLFAWLTGGASLASKVGWIGKVGKFIWAWDTLGNGMNAARGGYGLLQNGWNWSDGLRFAAGSLGTAGNIVPKVLPARAPTAAANTVAEGTAKAEAKLLTNTAKTVSSTTEASKGLPPGFDPAKGFASFDDFKKAFGAAGPGQAWHHVVEQTINSGKFAPELLNNPANLFRLPHGKGTIHAKISGYYSSKIPGLTGNKTVREWLSTKSFQEQFDFGIDVIKQFGGSQYVPPHLR